MFCKDSLKKIQKDFPKISYILTNEDINTKYTAQDCPDEIINEQEGNAEDCEEDTRRSNKEIVVVGISGKALESLTKYKVDGFPKKRLKYVNL